MNSVLRAEKFFCISIPSATLREKRFSICGQQAQTCSDEIGAQGSTGSTDAEFLLRHIDWLAVHAVSIVA
jgi:hypothetical protein